MYFSRKTILTHGRRPLYAASRVLNASSASASSVFATCWVNSTKRTYALIRTVRSRAYSSKAGGGAAGSSGPGPEVQVSAGTGLPFYSAQTFESIHSPPPYSSVQESSSTHGRKHPRNGTHCHWPSAPSCSLPSSTERSPSEQAERSTSMRMV